MLDLFSLHRESCNTEPILILAVAGADPISQITELAKRVQVKYIEVNYILCIWTFILFIFFYFLLLSKIVAWFYVCCLGTSIVESNNL